MALDKVLTNAPNLRFNSRMRVVLAVLGASLMGLCGSVSADVFFESFDVTGSTAAIEVTGSVTGSGSLTANSGTVDVFLEGSEGSFSSLSLSAGSLGFGDISFALTSSGIPAGLGSTSGFGFSLAPSSFTLSPSGSDTYLLGGDLDLIANMGSASFTDPLGQPLTSFDFSANPVNASATLLGTSTITINDLNPSAGTLSVSADLRFDSVTVGSFSSAPFVNINVGLSSTDTISFGGQMTLIPEPGTFSLLALGLLGLCGGRRKMRRT